MENTQRINYIDFIKGAAVIFMMFQHLGVWFWKIPWNQINNLFIDHPIYMATNALGGFSAPAFITCAGFGAYYFMEKYNSSKAIILRGVFLIICGYLLNLAVPIWFTYGSWYVLHLIGFCLILSPLLVKRNNLKSIVILIIIVLIISTLGQYFLNTPYKYSSKRMGNYNLSGGVFRLMFFEGHFPIFPWIVFFISGIFTAKKIQNNEKSSVLYFSISSLLGAIFLLSFSIFLPNLIHSDFKIFFRLSTSFYPLRPIMLFFLLFLITFTIYCFSLLDEKYKIKKRNPIVLTGKLSLTIFAAHIIIFKQGLHLLGYYKYFSTNISYFLTIFISFLFAVMSIIWYRFHFKYSIEWFLHKIK